MLRLFVGIILGVVLVFAGGWVWLTYGHPPVAVADGLLPFERYLTQMPLHARIDSEMPKAVPVEANETTFIAGAHIYREQCAYCHGISGTPSAVGPHMFPDAPPLWEKHHGEVVGVSDDPPGETYWKVSNGIRLTGMPAYKNILSETQMWQVSVLLANADKPLPPEAVTLLKEPLVLDPPLPAGLMTAKPIAPMR